MNHEYYKITGGHAQAAVDQFEEGHVGSGQARTDMVNELGAGGTYYNSGKVLGFLFDHNPGQGWRVPKGLVGVFVPDVRTKIGRSVKKKMESLPNLPEWRDFSSLLGVSSAADIYKLYYATYERIGEALILSVPVVEDQELPVIDGAEHIKKSEYWALKEGVE